MQSSQPPFSPSSGHSRPAIPTGRKILVIDDEPYLRDFMRLALERAGYAVSEAANGREGLIAYTAQRPDCVVTDLLMPEKEGLETIMALRRHAHQARILAVSGGADRMPHHFLRAARQLGADETLPKPFTVSDLLDAVRRLAPAVV